MAVGLKNEFHLLLTHRQMKKMMNYHDNNSQRDLNLPSPPLFDFLLCLLCDLSAGIIQLQLRFSSLQPMKVLTGRAPRVVIPPVLYYSIHICNSFQVENK